MKYIVAASLFAAFVSAQQIPNCALSCAISQVSASKPDFQADPKNCPTLPEGTNALTDTNVQKCLCKTTKFQKAFADCAKKSGCTDAEQCDLWTYSSSLCGGFGPDYALSDSLEPAQCKSSGGGSGGSGGGSSAAPPAGTSAPPAGTSAPAEPSAPAESSGAGAAPPAETSAPAASSGAAAPPSYGSPSTVATSAAAGASGAAPSTTPTYVPSSGSTVVLSGAAAVFAGFVALFAL